MRRDRARDARAGEGDPTGGAQNPSASGPVRRKPTPPVTAAGDLGSGSASERIRELERTVSSLAVGIDQVERDIERIASSRAWRWGHGLTTLVWRIRRRRMVTTGAVERALERVDQIRRSNPGLPVSAEPAGPVSERAPRAYSADAVSRAEQQSRREQLARELRGHFGDPPTLDPWPTVTAVILSRDGHARVQRLLEGLRMHTDYPALDVIVVDNASERPLSTTVQDSGLASATVLRLEHHLTFAEANNAAAGSASGEILLFLNDDIEPFERAWLKELVATARADGIGAAGATLLHVAHDHAVTASGWILQHRGIRFRIDDHLPRAYNDGDGEELFGESLSESLRCPAVTAACMAIQRPVFERVGGFGRGYRFGTEDVDLGLRLLSAGLDVVCVGRAVAFHRESATQASRASVEIAENRRVNRELFCERWGARLRRELRSARLSGNGYWTTERAHLGITVTSLDDSEGWGDGYTAHELGQALEAHGIRVTYLPRKQAAEHAVPSDLDALVTLMDDFDLQGIHPAVTVFAWVRNWADRWVERPWLSRVDRCLCSSAGLASVIEHAVGVTSVPFALATNPNRFRQLNMARSYDYVLTANRWGVERAIEKAFAPRPGERVGIFGKGWEDVSAVADHWCGPVPYAQLPDIYARARVVLDDTAGPTLPYGAINARVFDALACGALVVTNCAQGARELFDDDFPVWSGMEDLRGLLDELLTDESRRLDLVARYRATVLAGHTYEHRARRLLELAHDSVESLSFVIRIGAPDWERATRWGDLYFAQAVAQELRRRGHSCAIQVLAEWNGAEGSCYDVSIVLRGRSRHRPKPGQLNVLWAISHPGELTASECDDYDLIAAASASHASVLAEQTRTPVFALEQATDPRRFWPDPDPAVAHDLVFVGNSRGVRRQALDWLLPTERDVAVWGGDWDGLIDQSLVRGEFIANDALRRVYSSAKIVLADHWPDMRQHGYISNRIYDALASGAIVLSDQVDGLQERFGDTVAVYHSAEDLAGQIELLLADQKGRRELAMKGRELVLGAHTFERRVDALLERVKARWSELGREHHIAASRPT